MGKSIWIILLLALSFSEALAADGSTGSGRFDFRAKSESKKTSRWTLEDWLAQKERNRMMDLWLAMYAPSPYEFFLSGAHQASTTSTLPETIETNVVSGRGSIGAYATIIGLEGYYENNTTEKFSDSGLALNLRLVGNAVQGTHLIGFYGLRSLRTEVAGAKVNYNQSFAGGDLNLYLNRHFGLSGRYQIYLPVEQNDLGTVDGQRSEAGLFVDFSAVRVFGGWFKDSTRIRNGGLQTETIRTGIQSGLKFFF